MLVVVNRLINRTGIAPALLTSAKAAIEIRQALKQTGGEAIQDPFAEFLAEQIKQEEHLIINHRFLHRLNSCCRCDPNQSTLTNGFLLLDSQYLSKTCVNKELKQLLVVIRSFKVLTLVISCTVTKTARTIQEQFFPSL